MIPSFFLRRIFSMRTALACAWASACLISTPAFADSVTAFKTFLSSTPAARGQFTQQQAKSRASTPATLKTLRGDFMYLRPGRFIWRYLDPYSQVVQGDGEKLYLFDQDLNQVTIKPLNGALGASPAGILFGTANGNELDQHFRLKNLGNRQGLDWLEATPRTREGQFDKISIGMKDGIPVRLEIIDAFGQTMVLQFSAFERNPTLKAEQFRFVLPAGVDVLRP